ncbi:hypothetical protein V8J88_14545 [Massilia sp. W12]|uniref:hypothetical protein n=1 Tax=Massilia sp. W12 TaxID=3126507 RepID=UPI0030CFF074
MVIKKNGGIPTRKEILESLFSKISCIQKTSDGKVKINQGSEFGESNLILNETKLKLFYLEGQPGLDLLANIEAELSKLSSERRLMPSPEHLESTASARVLSTAGAFDKGESLSNINNLSIRRMSWAIQLKAVETIANNIPPQYWQEEREKFYKFTQNHILRFDRLFDHIDYLPRILSLAISAGDVSQVGTICNSAFNSINLLKSKTDKALIINGKEVILQNSDRIWHNLTKWIKELIQETIYRSNIQKELIDRITCLKVINSFIFKSKNLAKGYIINSADRLSASFLGIKKNTEHPQLEPLSSADINIKLLIFHVSRAEEYSFLKSHSDQEKIGIFYNLLKVRKPSFNDSPIPTENEICENSVLFKNISITSKQDGDIVNVGYKRNRKDKKIRLGICNILTTQKSWMAGANDNPDLSLERYHRIRRIVNEAISANPRPTYLIFPELSIPEEWLPTIATILLNSNINLIAGLDYKRNNKGEIYSDVALILMQENNQPFSAIQFRQRKSMPAPGEEKELLHLFGLNWYKTDDGSNKKTVPSPKKIYNHNDFYFGVLVCSELQNIAYRHHFQGKVDCMMVLSWNQDLESFTSLIDSASLDVHAYITLVNNRAYGDSRVRAPAKENYKRDICRLRGGENEHIVVVEIDVEILRKFQSRAKRWPSDDDPFKPVPEGFTISDERKKIP